MDLKEVANLFVELWSSEIPPSKCGSILVS